MESYLKKKAKQQSKYYCTLLNKVLNIWTGVVAKPDCFSSVYGLQRSFVAFTQTWHTYKSLANNKVTFSLSDLKKKSQRK